jgi:hypothetical protein
MMAEERRDRHLHKWASRLGPEDAARFWVVVDALRLKFAERDYHSSETYFLSVEFERLQAKSDRAFRAAREIAKAA